MSNLFGNSTSRAFGSASQQSANPFGASSTQNKPGGLFSLNTSTTSPPQSSNLFGSSSSIQQAGSLFGGQTQQQQAGGLFGGQTSQPQQGGSLFGGLRNNQQGGGLFGGQTSQQQQGGSLLGGVSGPGAGGSLFGLPTSQAQQGSLFGSQASQPQQSNTLFGNATQQQQGPSLFGSQSAQPQKEQTLFNASVVPPLQKAGSLLFPQNSQNVQQPQQQQQEQLQQQLQQQAHINALIGPSKQSRVWLEQALIPDYKSVPEQVDLIFKKWNPEMQESVGFHTYLYNTVPEDAAPFFRPGPLDNEDKWEEAHRKRPSPGAIPFIVRGFYQLGQRVLIQEEHLRVLQGRLHEINSGLTDLLNRHDVDITTRTTECRRKHQALSQKCLLLATKTQVLRNRGYAMDAPEEELRQKLMTLEKKVFDPALNGRGEEIWARMVSVRERGRIFQYEIEKRGLVGRNEKEQTLDEETLKKVGRILEDYNKQLQHLSKEMEQIKNDFAEWEATMPMANGVLGNSANRTPANATGSSR
ncbi:hypothetical protein MMC13_005995 [Lambiella insularis]|nr:hypothetical protein [Lambiella insularis]